MIIEIISFRKFRVWSYVLTTGRTTLCDRRVFSELVSISYLTCCFLGKIPGSLFIIFLIRFAAEIILLDGMICVYRSNVDLFFYVMSGADENELILVSALNCLYDSISLVLRKNVEKKALIDDMDIAMLIVDEICDNGFVDWFFLSFFASICEQELVLLYRTAF